MKYYYRKLKSLAKNILIKTAIGRTIWRLLSILNEIFNKNRITYYTKKRFRYTEFLKNLTDINSNYLLLREPKEFKGSNIWGSKRFDIDILISENSYDSSIPKNKYLTRIPFLGSYIVHIKTPSGVLPNTKAYEFADFPAQLANYLLTNSIINNSGVKVPNDLGKLLSSSYHSLFHKGFIKSSDIEIMRDLNHELSIFESISLNSYWDYFMNSPYKPDYDTLLYMCRFNSFIREKFLTELYNRLKSNQFIKIVFISTFEIKSDIWEKIIKLSNEYNLKISNKYYISKNNAVNVIESTRGSNWNQIGRPLEYFFIMDENLANRASYDFFMSSESPGIEWKILATYKEKLRKITHTKGHIHSTDNSIQSRLYLETLKFKSE